MGSPRPETLAYIERTFPGATLTALAGDASTRNFYRFTGPDGLVRVLMEYDGPFAAPTNDLLLSSVFQAAALPVARVLDSCGSAGCVVLEDLGDLLLEAALSEAGPSSEQARALLERAVDLAVQIATRGTPALAASGRSRGPALDAERFRFEMDFFLQHFVKGWRGCSRPPAELRARLHELADRAARTPRRIFCHRDFHSRNLMIRPDGNLAMVDIQDARWGPDSYDLASLLRDAYVELDERWIDPLVERYRSSLPEPPEPRAFRRRFDTVCAQRMIKALGTFGYQMSALGRRRYAAAIPRTQARLRRLLPGLDQARRVGELLAAIGLL